MRKLVSAAFQPDQPGTQERELGPVVVVTIYSTRWRENSGHEKQELEQKILQKHQWKLIIMHQLTWTGKQSKQSNEFIWSQPPKFIRGAIKEKVSIQSMDSIKEHLSSMNVLMAQQSNNNNYLPYLFCINLDKIMKFPMNKRDLRCDGRQRMCLLLPERRPDLQTSGRGDLCIHNLQLAGTAKAARKTAWTASQLLNLSSPLPPPPPLGGGVTPSLRPWVHIWCVGYILYLMHEYLGKM